MFPRKLWLDEDGNQVRQWSVEDIETLHRKRVGRWSRSDTLGVIGLGVRNREYFNLLPGLEWSALLLTPYGFPLTIIGMALKARTLPSYKTLLDDIYRDDLVILSNSTTVCRTESRAHCFRRNNNNTQHLWRRPSERRKRGIQNNDNTEQR